MFGKRTILGPCACFACPAGAGGGSVAAISSRLADIPRARRYAGSRADGTGLPPLHHIGLVVRDRDRTLANLSDALGFGLTHTFEGYFDGVKLASPHTGFGVRGGWVVMNNTAMEIIEPTDDHGPHAVYLKEQGEGLHHLAYWVASVSSEIEAMARGGTTPRLVADATGPEQPVRWCYVEGVLAGPTLIELIERNPISEQVYAEVFGAIGGEIPA
jgi:catechol 2,3-dioxygenase-like lactoylglutathione lyase family enzyme